MPLDFIRNPLEILKVIACERVNLHHDTAYLTCDGLGGFRGKLRLNEYHANVLAACALYQLL